MDIFNRQSETNVSSLSLLLCNRWMKPWVPLHRSISFADCSWRTIRKLCKVVTTKLTVLSGELNGRKTLEMRRTKRPTRGFEIDVECHRNRAEPEDLLVVGRERGRDWPRHRWFYRHPRLSRRFPEVPELTKQDPRSMSSNVEQTALLHDFESLPNDCRRLP